MQFSAHEKKELTRKVLALQKAPDLFIKKVLGEDTLEAYHERICREVVEYDRLAIKACHAVGKTWICGRLVPWFISCFPQSIVITTAPTNRQVETLLWGEIRKSVKRSKTFLGGKMLTKKWTIDDDHYAMGFSPQANGGDKSDDAQQGSSFQGFHAKNVMIIFDEATGIPKDLYTMAEGLLTSGVTVKWVCIANPTSTTSEFFQICKKAEWRVISLSCFDSPNMIANGFTNRVELEKELETLRLLPDTDRLKRIKNYLKPNGHLLSAQWAVAKLYDWGFSHPLAKSKVLGEFPDSSDDTIVKWESMQAAVNREPNYDYSIRYIGVDVARFGDDLSVITEITDTTFRGAYPHRKEDTVETTGRITALFFAADLGKETHIIVDGTGIGAGVVDNLKDMKARKLLPHYVYIHDVNFGTKITHDTDDENEKLNKLYENTKAFMFDKLNDDLKNILSMPDEEIYQEETVNILFKFSKHGKLMVESKDDYKSRIKKSPDRSDSLALANYGRYLKPNYGSFKSIDSSKPAESFSARYSKKDRDRKTKIKVKSY